MTSNTNTFQHVDALMEQAQVFASAWALVGSRFDDGGELENAEEQKCELRAMIEAALASAAQQPAPREPLTREQAWEIVNRKTGVMMAIRLTEAAHGITARKEQG